MPSPDVLTLDTSTRAVGEFILRERAELTTTLATIAFTRHPQVKSHADESMRKQFRHESHYLLSYLAAALFADQRELFVDYVAWAKVAYATRGSAPGELQFNLRCLCDALRFELPLASAEVATGFVRHAIERFPDLPDDTPTFINPEQPYTLLARQYMQLLIQGDRRLASRLIVDAVENGTSVRDIYIYVFQRTQYEIGRLWQTNQISVAREHFCTAATHSIMAQLYPHIAAGQDKTGKVIVTTCVAGDQHELGVRMVADFFEMAGWKSYCLGANTPTASIVSEIIERKANVLGISIAIAYHIPVVAEVIQAVRQTAECSGVRILLGGHPCRLDPDLWAKMGADGDALDAEDAIEKTRTWFDF